MEDITSMCLMQGTVQTTVLVLRELLQYVNFPLKSKQTRIDLLRIFCADDNFMCNKCNIKKIDPPTPRHTHTYTHALVRCQPKPSIPEEKSPPTLEDKVNNLTTSVGTLDTRISRLEDCLTRVESRLELLLTHLNIATAATSSVAATD